jgi:hypothetical protein
MSTPLQVYLDDDDVARLESFASERGWTKSQVIRAAIRALTRGGAQDPVLDLSGDIDGLPPELSADFDRHLNESFVAEPRPHYRTRRKKTVRR